MRVCLHVFGLIFLAIILLVFPLVIASSGWTRTYQGGNMDVLTPYSVVQTQDDGYATAIFGYLRSDSASGMLTSSYELQILKTDCNGNVQWKKSYPTVEDPNHVTPTINTYADSYVIVQTADQGYVIAGSGFWLFKINSQGTILWSKTYTLDESTGSGKLNSMIQTNEGGFALAGAIYTYEGNEDFWLVKTDSQGVAQWNKTYNSGSYTDQSGGAVPRDDQATCVVQTKDSGYALVGSASLYSSSTSSLTYSAWVVKTDSKGNQIWNKGYDLLNLQGYKTTIIQTSDNGYAIAGTQNNDFCLFKIKSSNQLEWSQIYGDSQTDTPCSLVQLEDGGYAVAGTWTPSNNISIRNTMGLVRTDSAGKTLWTRTYSAKEEPTTSTYSRDQAQAMTRTRDGSYAIVGSTQFGSETHQDVFFVKTETLEQTLQTTPNQTPTNTEPSNTENPEQTSQPSSNSSQTDPTQTPSNTNSSNTSDDTLQIFDQDRILVIAGVVLVVVIAIVGLGLIRTRKKRIVT